MTKQEIINSIQQAAKINNGIPLGKGRFEKETGIKEHEWNKYWARLSDAQKEAGFIPNQKQGAYTEEFLIKKLIILMRKLSKFPTYREINVEKNINDSKFPDKVTFGRLGSKKQLAEKVMDYCVEKTGYDDIVKLCQPIVGGLDNEKNNDNTSINIGEVYLFKSGRFYKIGKTNDTVRRGSEIRIQLPERMDLIHSIKTDDPTGIETYWHKRFEAKRMNGEWFDLNSSDIKVFKRWRRIV
ncbi:MAG TPA: GIY-YIG nuclease family protein [Candidatus Pacearchaeota archaeon]|nr:GIY-YIG nuclease family protein [Candidatus Pacearchaeota archaeon]